MKKKINITFDQKRIANVGMSLHLTKCITKALEFQGVDVPCEVNVLVTDDSGIRAINQASRQIDSATDVLSFPMHVFEAGKLPEDWTSYIEPSNGRVVLGDMVISLDRVIEQAMEYGHGIKREIGYLTVHSILHLLGYDHLDEGPMKRQMRRQEETIMAQLMLTR